MRLTRFALLAAALIALLYGRALAYPFVYDDRALIEASPYLGDWANLPQALGRDLFFLAGDVRPSPYWRPVITLSYFIDHASGSGAPWSFHLTNLLALFAASIGAFALLSNRGHAGLLALLWVVWPTQVEGACNIAGRTDVFCAAFFLAALCVRQPVLAASLAFLACGSKEIGVLLPLVSYALSREGPWRAHAAGALFFLLGRALVMAQTPLLPEDAVAPTLASMAGAGHRIAWWIGRLILPIPLSPALDLAAPGPLGALAGWALLALMLALLWRYRSPERLAGAALVLGALLPVSGLLTANVRVGDTLLTLPLLGALLLGVSRARPRWVAALILLALAASWPRVSDWSSEHTLWARAHARVPEDPTVRLNYARAVRAEDPALALALLEGRTLEGRRGRELAATRAGARIALGQEREALDDLLLAANPGDPEARWANEMACVLAVAYAHPEGLPACQSAAQQTPPDPNVFNALGIASMAAGEREAGLLAFERAASLDPDNPTFTANLARARAEERGEGP